jgi:hypothetical protein
MKWKAVFLTTCLVLICGGALTYWEYRRASRYAEWSAASAMHQRVLIALENYKAKEGEYPPSLQVLDLDYRNSDGATPETLRRFEYESQGDSFELVLPLPR